MGFLFSYFENGGAEARRSVQVLPFTHGQGVASFSAFRFGARSDEHGQALFADGVARSASESLRVTTSRITRFPNIR